MGRIQVLEREARRVGGHSQEILVLGDDPDARIPLLADDVTVDAAFLVAVVAFGSVHFLVKSQQPENRRTNQVEGTYADETQDTNQEPHRSPIQCWTDRDLVDRPLRQPEVANARRVLLGDSGARLI